MTNEPSAVTLSNQISGVPTPPNIDQDRYAELARLLFADRPAALMGALADWARTVHADDPDPEVNAIVEILATAATAWPLGGQPSRTLPMGCLLWAVDSFARVMAAAIIADGGTP